MLNEEDKLKPIDTIPLTNLTPEMEEVLDRAVGRALPLVDEAIRQLEIIMDSEKGEGNR